METFRFPHSRNELSFAYVALFEDVTNVQAIRKRIVKASTAEGVEGEQEREAINFAFINARLITSTLHLQTAIHQAILAALQGALRAKSIHAEMLWALNPTNNITEAIRRYGVSDDNQSLIVVKICGPEISAMEIENSMKAIVHGTLHPLADLQNLTDWSSIKKYHKLNNNMGIRDPAEEMRIVDNIVTTSVAMKSVMG